jgi:hypothetical protein
MQEISLAAVSLAMTVGFTWASTSSRTRTSRQSACLAAAAGPMPDSPGPGGIDHDQGEGATRRAGVFQTTGTRRKERQGMNAVDNTTGERLCWCGRPAVTEPEDVAMCAEHRAWWDAKAELEDWELALSILEPWVEAARPIGAEKLTRCMEATLEEARARRAFAHADVMRAEEALEP